MLSISARDNVSACRDQASHKCNSKNPQNNAKKFLKIPRSVGNTKRTNNTLIFIKIHASWKQFFQSKLELPHMEFAIHCCASLSVVLLLTFLITKDDLQHSVFQLASCTISFLAVCEANQPGFPFSKYFCNHFLQFSTHWTAFPLAH